MLKHILESPNHDIRQAALNTLLVTSRLRGEKKIAAAANIVTGDSRRTIFDCQSSTVLSSATTARSENGDGSADDSVNRAFDGLGTTRDFYRDVFGRNSIDDRGMRLDGYVHYGERFNNAFWDGQRMVFGDGDGALFTDFTCSLDVIGHEMTHGVVEASAGLEYHNQSGALNESVSDVFGSLIKQWHLQQTADEADWLIGADIFTPNVQADALRSLKAPGTAYDNETFGKDPQPDRMSKYVRLPDNDFGDNGGVHINSGIPNKAFYLAARNIGGFAWEAPGQIWYETLKASGPKTEFKEFAETSFIKAGLLFGTGSIEQKAVLDAWHEVEIRLSGKVTRQQPRPSAKRQPAGEEVDFTALARQLQALATQMKAVIEAERKRKAG